MADAASEPIPKWKIAENVVFRVLDGEAVVLNLDSGYYFNLNEVGSGFWRGLERGESFEAIMDGLSAAYDVEPDRLRRDLDALVASLKQEKLIVDAA